MEVLVSSASRGLAPREGLELSMLKVGRTRPSMKPRCGPQAGKSGYPRSQNTDTTHFLTFLSSQTCSCYGCNFSI